MRFIRWFLTLLLVAVIGGVIALQFINFNQFKDLAAQKVREATGRDLTINGDIKVSFYPVFGAKIDHIALSNMLGGEQPSMVTVDKISVGVRVLPLLQKQVELEKIILQHPTVYLEKNASGKANWEFPKAAATGSAGGSNASSTPVRLSGIEVVDGAFSYQDATSGSKTEFTNINAAVSMIDLDSILRAAITAKYKGVPIQLNVTTDAPSALMTDKGSNTTLDAMVYGINTKLQGKISSTPTKFSIGDMELAIERMVAKGSVDVTLGGDVPKVNAVLDFDAMDLTPVMALAQAAQAGAAAVGGNGAPSGAKKTTYIDTSVFKGFDGSLSLSAESVETSTWKVAQPKIRANIASGIVAMAAAGQFSSPSQPPMNISFTTPDLGAILHPDGGAFSAKAKSQDKDVSAQGTLALVPDHLSLTGANIGYNGETITGRASLDRNEEADAELQLTKDGREWEISAKTPSVQKLMTSEGAPLELSLQSAEQRAELVATASNADNVIKLNPLVLKLNGGTGKGYITFDQKTPTPKLDVNLDFQSLDLNPLIAFAQSGSGGGSPSSVPAPSSRGDSSGAVLKTMNGQVSLKAGTLKAKDWELSKVNLTATIQDGVLNLSLPEAGLYQGTTSLKARVDGNAPSPKFELTTEGAGVNIGALMVQAMHSNTFAGTGAWKAEVTGSGLQTPALYPTLDGRGNFSLEQGTVRGMDLFKLMSAVRGQMGVESFVKTTDETNNINAKGTFEIAKGVISNKDLVVQSPNIEAAGSGTVSLPEWTIDYRFDPKVGERRKGGEGEKFVGQGVPVYVKGSIDKPRVSPDAKALINTGINALESIKEGGFGDKVKGVEKYLAPFGLGGGSGNQQAAPADTTTPPADAEPAKKKHGLGGVLKGLFGN